MEILNETEGSPPAETVTQEQNRLAVARTTDAQGLLRQSQVFKWRAMKTIFFTANFEFLGVPWRENGVGYEVGYRRLGKRLAAAERAGMRWQALEAIRLIALTGCRREEATAPNGGPSTRPSPAPGRHQEGIHFASTAEGIGLTLPTIAALLGHSASGSATLGYIHKVDTALISAANRVAERVAASMKGEVKDENGG
jgi:hypothetical protein